MSGTVCRWHKSDEVPGGRFLVPGCWNRAINGDHADCHCPKPPKRVPKKAIPLLEALAELAMDEEQIDDAIEYLMKTRKR